MWKTAFFILIFCAILTIGFSANVGAAEIFETPPDLSGGVDATTDIPNPIETGSFFDLLDKISGALIIIGGPLAMAAIIFTGFKFVTASATGNAKALEDAKKMFWWVIVGTAIVVGSSLLVKVTINTIENLRI